MGPSVLGIDLGTTNSVVASLDVNGEVRVLPNASGEEITPSVVYFETSRGVVVGSEARDLASLDPANGVVLIKRSMGTDSLVHVAGQVHAPEAISALILRQLVAAATDAPEPKVVVTVPAFFGTAEREATWQAAQIAGLHVLALLDEPVAAAVHYGLSTEISQTVLVYDLGGGTFDTTVLQVEHGAVTVVATDGHHRLGGADVDERLLGVVLEQLEQQLAPEDYEELTGDRTLFGQLSLDVEAAKRSLSGVTSRSLTVRTARDRATVVLNRHDLAAACEDLADTTTEIVERVLDAARAKGVGSIDDVIMVGGSSRLPALADRLTARFGRAPRLVEPDLAVAKGAARYAALLSEDVAPPAARKTMHPGRTGLAVGVTPATPRAIGVLVEDSHDPAGQRSFVDHVVAANTALPAHVVVGGLGTILDDQESVRIQIFEQAGAVAVPEVDRNRRVIDGELGGFGTLPAGSVIELTFDIALDGRLTLTAREPRSGRSLRLEAFVEGVVDTAETERLTEQVGLMTVRG
ncbi:Hsp70 family protein [Myceligenerans halotolerans]